MPSQRRRSSKVSDDHQHSLRGEESHADPYSRLPNDSRQTSTYRRTESAASHGGRQSFDMNRASSSRAHRESDWRPKDTENRYGHHRNGYYRERKEEYDMPKPRGSGSWPAHTESETRYSERERDWQPYDAGYPASSFSESSWNMPSNTHVDHRSGHQERWRPHDYSGHRGLSLKDRIHEPSQAVLEPRRDWTHEQTRGKDEEKWRNGSGWELTRSEAEKRVQEEEDWANGWGRGGASPPEHPDYGFPPQPSPSYSLSPPHEKSVADDRSWEPAASWKSGEYQKYRSQNGSRGDYHTKSPATGRRETNTSTNPSNYRNYSHSSNHSQRDWRNDDGNPNNWNRRESHGSERYVEASPARPRKHRGRSPSWSPAESHYSRRSSRGRTGSPSSPASKRRRRDSKSPASAIGQLSSQDYSGWYPRQTHAPSQPPEVYEHNISRRDVSPVSSLSTGRSPSRTRSPNPELQPSLASRLSAPFSAPATLDTQHKDLDARRNGSKVNGAHPRVITIMRNRTQPPTQVQSPDTMPPPTIIPPAHYLRPTYDPLPLPKMPMGPTRITPKASGFKPIGQNSSSLKKFFPGDDDDMDISSDLSAVAESDSQEPPSQPRLDRPPEPHTLAPNPLLSNEDEQPLTRVPSSPLARSGASSVVMEEESAEPQPPPVPQPPPETIDTGASTPSVQSRSELYALVSQVGEGTFGKVYKAQNTVTKRYVALKRIRMESEKEGFPVTAMREIKLLQSLRHENVVRLYEMMVSNGSVYMVFEYMDHDLTGILSQTQFVFTDAHLKSLCHQMLAGLAYLHHKGVIHRDIKGSNILLNNRGELKLADFGLARFYQKRRRSDYTNRVITLWYRPPELLLGATIYGPEVDMWSAGCIMLELFTKKPVFQGDDEIHQLDTIYRVIGTPTVDRWPDITNLPWFELVKPKGEIANHFREMFRKWMSPAALDLAEWLLCYDPAARATAAQAMEASYFTQEEPPASAPVGLATLHGEWHELETKRERAKKRRRNESSAIQ